MPPTALEDLEISSDHIENVSDQSVFPPPDADIRLKKLWAQHGHIQSSTYSNPELTSLASLVRYNAQVRPEEVAYLVPRGESFAFITWKQFDYLTEYAAAHYSRAFQSDITRAQLERSQPTIALLGSGNTFRYWVSEVALLKLGVRVLLLSDKNADIARDHLLRTCHAVGIVVEQKYVLSVHGLEMPVVPFVPVSLTWNPQPVPSFTRFETEDVWNQQIMIIHSSGSTGLPKPIIHTNRSMMLIARMYRLFQSFIVENWYLCFPLYHIAGVSIILGGIPTGLPTTFPPEDWPPSPGAILTAWRKLEDLGRPVDCLHCAPAVIEDLYEYLSISANRDFSALTRLKIVQPGGAALSPVLLQRLVDLGVNVKTTYGSTEIGPPYRTIPDTIAGSCYKIRCLLPNDPHIAMDPQGINLYECVVYKGFTLAAELWTDPNAPNPFRTSDLFIQDPPNSGLYVLQGRKDDILVHSNGEKTNALPLQLAIEESHPDIHKIAVFGTDKPCTSAVLELSKESRADIGTLFQAIEKACEPFPAFSRLERNLILVLSDGEALPVTPKGNVRRHEAQKMYGQQIDNLYSKVFDSAEDETKETIDLCDLEFVRTCVASACGASMDAIGDNASFYTLGLDSQKAVRLRSSLAKRYGSFPLMYIFEFPTPRTLYEQMTSPKDAITSTTQNNIAWIENAIKRYTLEIDSWADDAILPGADKASSHIVYLTGATGALGNALLASFSADSKVKKVYCAIRGPSAQERLTESLASRGYDSSISTNPKFIPVPYDMQSATLGLDSAIYASLAAEVTTVIHNAWKMDFNQQVDMFEQDCLRGTLNLMRFAHLSAKKTFAFTSSVATNMGPSAQGKTITEAPIADDVSLALGTGYAQSKYIVERVSQIYAKNLDMTVRICRVGQLCGHSRLGSWNVTEMFPIMIITGLKYLTAMPVFEHQTVNWLPVDICAESIRAVLVEQGAEVEQYSVHNLVNPARVSWRRFLDNLEEASGIQFERVGMAEWVLRLQDLVEKMDGVPGAKLIGFFEGMAQAEEGEPTFENSRTAGMVRQLGESKSVDAGLLRLYLEKWKEVGFA